MVDNTIRDLFYELTALIADEKMNNGMVYWWILLDARVTFYFQGHCMDIKLPTPKLARYGFASEYNKKKYNEEEIARVRGIWKTFIDIYAAKREMVESGVSTVEEEFKDGILLENGAFGLKYKESWGWR